MKKTIGREKEKRIKIAKFIREVEKEGTKKAYMELWRKKKEKEGGKQQQKKAPNLARGGKTRRRR